MSYKRPLSKATRDVAMMLIILKNLDEGTLKDLVRRGQHKVNDGYPSGSLGGGTHSGEVSRPTESTAVSSIDGTTDNDQIGAALAKLFDGLADALKILTEVDQRKGFVLGAADKVKGRVNSVETCALCSEPAPKVHRIDGEPYCATTCYFKMRRRSA